MKSWAIVVGINEYPALAKQGPLAGAVADACDFAEWALADDGGKVEPDRLFFWSHPWPVPLPGDFKDYLDGKKKDAPPQWWNVDTGTAPPDQSRAPNAFEITQTIENLGRALRTKAFEEGDTETRRVYVFLAGHGVRVRTSDRNQETCFLAGDFRPLSSSLAGGLVPCDSFRRALLNNRFDEAILFTDCCRGGTARSALVAQQVSDFDGQPTQPHSIAYAAQDDMEAHETTQAPVRGAFSSALMRGLRTHRIGASHDLHAAPLKQYVLDNIKDFTDTGQMPSMSFLPDVDGPLIVSGPVVSGGPEADAGPVATVRVIDISNLPAGTQLLLKGGDNQPLPGVAPLVVAGPTVETPPLTPGLYSVELATDSARYKVFRHPSAEVVHVD